MKIFIPLVSISARGDTSSSAAEMCRMYWALQAPQAATVVALGTQDYSRACACNMDGSQPASAPAALSCLQATGARASRCERIVVDLPAYKDCALLMSLRCFCEASAVF